MRAAKAKHCARHMTKSPPRSLAARASCRRVTRPTCSGCSCKKRSNAKSLRGNPLRRSSRSMPANTVLPAVAAVKAEISDWTCFHKSMHSWGKEMVIAINTTEIGLKKRVMRLKREKDVREKKYLRVGHDAAKHILVHACVNTCNQHGAPPVVHRHPLGVVGPL